MARLETTIALGIIAFMACLATLFILLFEAPNSGNSLHCPHADNAIMEYRI